MDRYRRSGEECTHTLKIEPGRLYVKGIVRPQYGLIDNLSLLKGGESRVIIASFPLGFTIADRNASEKI